MIVETGIDDWTQYGTEDFLVRHGGKGRHDSYINKALILMGVDFHIKWATFPRLYEDSSRLSG